MNGSTLTLGLVGALAAAGTLLQRGGSLNARAVRYHGAPEILYHITKKSRFKADSSYTPVEGVNIGKGVPGIFLTDNPDHWLPWIHGGGKKYVVVFDTSLLSGGLWDKHDENGREVDFYIPRRGMYPEYFVKPHGFERLRLIEALPYDEAKSKYSNGWGWRTR